MTLDDDFYKSIKLFLRVNQFFCTAPMNSEIPINEQKIASSWKKKIHQILNLFWAVVISTSVCVATYRQHLDFDSNSLGFMTRVLYMGEYVIGTFNLVLILVSCQYQRKNYSLYIERLLQVDRNLRKCGVSADHNSLFKYLTVSLAIYGIFFMLVMVVDFCYNKMIVANFLRSSTVYTVPNIVGVLALTQYSGILICIKMKLEKINRTLKCLVLQKKNITSLISLPDFDRHHEHLGLDRVVDILRLQHSNLSRLVEAVNKSFGILILSTIVAAYIILSIQFYAFYKMTEGYTEDDIYLTLYTFLWILLHGGKVILILYPINDVTDKQIETGHILFELGLHSHDFSERVSLLIKTFSQQLLHEKTPPNALRIINLDMTLVSTLIGALATYLVILIQFDAAARDSSKSTNLTSCNLNFSN